MINSSDNFIEDVDATSFIDKVIKKSKSVAVIVDFWAPWCEPCKQITPILEQLTGQFNGKVNLVKINIDENQQLAQQLNIQSIPTVMAFYEGQPVNGFAGLKSPEEIKVFFEEVVSVSSVSADLIDNLNKKLESAELFLEKKEVEKAMEIFSELIASELPKKEMSRSMSGLGKCLLEMNKLEELDDFLNQLEEDLKNSNEIKELIEAKNFFSSILEKSEAEAQSSNTLDDFENKLKSSRKFILERNYSDAVDGYLFIIEKNSNWNDGIAKNELLSLFSFLGNNNSVTINGRSRLLNILYK
ncbi:MAG: thioredoxin [Alphaproteobacteria bacterium TMED93]|nr:MAG: thioredoxin [Betaproteobacteria bacterium TMED156]RPH03805.1 MAG: thioredoxin [Alphaproteobacteria bacterium TMED93]